MPKPVAEQVVVIAGASSGIGRATALEFARRVAVASCTVELVGVLAVGTVSLLVPREFPDATVWSGYGRGYGFVPLVLPVLGLLWLRHTSPARGVREAR